MNENEYEAPEGKAYLKENTDSHDSPYFIGSISALGNIYFRRNDKGTESERAWYRAGESSKQKQLFTE